MVQILKELSEKATEFRPTTIAQYTALQILRRLNGYSFSREYQSACEHHALLFLIDAYKRTALNGGASPEFFQCLAQT